MKVIELIKSLFTKFAGKEENVVAVNSVEIESVEEVIVEENVQVERNLEKIVSHEKVRNENKFFHTAIVQLSEGEVFNPSKLAGETAIEVGFHPAGYNCWNEEVEMLNDNEVKVTWLSFSTCD